MRMRILVKQEVGGSPRYYPQYKWFFWWRNCVKRWRDYETLRSIWEIRTTTLWYYSRQDATQAAVEFAARLRCRSGRDTQVIPSAAIPDRVVTEWEEH